MASINNPILGVLIGAGITAVLQSSAASIGILQTLVAQGLIGLDSAIFILFGQNIGTCVTRRYLASAQAQTPEARGDVPPAPSTSSAR